MPRIRSVHPGLWTDEAFVSCSMTARLLFIGLWNEADDKGVFEWKPITLKMRILPVDNVDVAAHLEELRAANMVANYEFQGRHYGAIRNFRKFQRPKKPNDVHPMPSDFRNYVYLPLDGSEAVGKQFGTDGEKPFQMEDGGGRRDKEASKEELCSGDYTRGRRRVDVNGKRGPWN